MVLTRTRRPVLPWARVPRESRTFRGSCRVRPVSRSERTIPRAARFLIRLKQMRQKCRKVYIATLKSCDLPEVSSRERRQCGRPCVRRTPVRIDPSSGSALSTRAKREVLSDVQELLGRTNPVDAPSCEWRKWRTRYLQLHRVQIEAARRRRLATKDALFVAVMPDVGFGNQVASMASALLLAMLSRRSLLIHWPQGLLLLEESRGLRHVSRDERRRLAVGSVVSLESDEIIRSAQHLVIHEETSKTDQTFSKLCCAART